MTQLIIAGNYRQYKDYLQIHNKTPREAIYIADEEALAGRQGEVIYIGTYWQNKAFDSPYLAIIEKYQLKSLAEQYLKGHLQDDIEVTYVSSELQYYYVNNGSRTERVEMRRYRDEQGNEISFDFHYNHQRDGYAICRERLDKLGEISIMDDNKASDVAASRTIVMVLFVSAGGRLTQTCLGNTSPATDVHKEHFAIIRPNVEPLRVADKASGQRQAGLKPRWLHHREGKADGRRSKQI